MAPFRFRLDQVLAYRRQLEEQAMQELAKASMMRDATRARVESLESELAEQRARLCAAAGLDAAERWLVALYEKALKQDITMQRALLAEQEREVDRCRTALVARAQERELLDKLKEKQAARHAEQERQLERRIFDETATLRYKPAAV